MRIPLVVRYILSDWLNENWKRFLLLPFSSSAETRILWEREREREEKNRQTWLTIRTRQRYQRPNERNNILFHTDIAILRYPLINYVTTLRKFDQLAPRIYLLLRTFNLFLRERRSINIAASTASLNLNRINILTVSTTDRNTIYHRREIGPNTGWDRIYHARYRAN